MLCTREAENSEIIIVDPKADGIGFLYPPEDSPKNWGERSSSMDISALGLHSARSFGLAKKDPLPGSTFPNDASDNYNLQRSGNARRMGGRTTLQFSFAFDGGSTLRIRISPEVLTKKFLLVCAYSSKQEEWIFLECVNVYDGKKYKMLNCTKTNGNVPYNVVFPSQFAHLLIQ